MSQDGLWNTCGVLYQALYVMVCKATFSFIECQGQPGAEKTLLKYPDITCWSSEHLQAIGLFIFGLGFYVIGVWAVFFWFNLNAVYLFKDSPNRDKWRSRLIFLVDKWRPNKWYWGQVYLTRNLLVSLIAVFQSDDGYFQIFLFFVFITSSTMLT